MTRILFILVPIILTTPVTHANNTQQGFSGELGLFAIYSEGQNNLSTDSNSVITSINNTGNSITSSAIFPLGTVRYQLDKHILFAGQSEDTFIKGILTLDLGYEYQINRDSLITVAFSPTIVEGKVWQNPYLTNSKRVETNIEGNAYRLKYENQFLTTNIAYYDRDVKYESSQHSELNRGGDGYFAQIAIVLPFSSSVFIEPSIFYQRDDATGKAMAYDKIGAGLSATLLHKEYSFVIDGRYAKSDFDAMNPLFDSIRNDEHLNLTLSLVEGGIFSIQPLSLIAQVSYSESDSNISFYSEDDVSFLLGCLYEF